LHHRLAAVQHKETGAAANASQEADQYANKLVFLPDIDQYEYAMAKPNAWTGV
jgi:hypothetical protein